MGEKYGVICCNSTAFLDDFKRRELDKRGKKGIFFSFFFFGGYDQNIRIKCNVYFYSMSFFFFFVTVYYKILNIVPCAIQ